MHSIFSNLFENAVKYSGEDLKIELSLSQVGNTANVIIKDNGIGISDEDKLRIFDKFYRVGNEETRKTKGTGLGLFIVNYLVKTQDAQIDVYNNSPKGSIFELRFKVLEA